MSSSKDWEDSKSPFYLCDFTQLASFTFESSIDWEATMNGLGFMYDQESVQMERAVADIL